MRIEGSVAFVTGANRGLGLAFVRELPGRGVKKLCAGVRNPEGVDLPDIIPVTFDVTDPAAVAAAALCCSDVTLLINNADRAGRCRCARSGGDRQRARVFGNQLLRDYSGKSGIRAGPFGFARPILTAYAATKSAAWSFTNALRIDVRDKGMQVLALHVGFVDTDLTRDFDVKKSDPRVVAARTLDALEKGHEEVLADEQTEALKRSLSTAQPYYLNPQPL